MPPPSCKCWFVGAPWRGGMGGSSWGDLLGVVPKEQTKQRCGLFRGHPRFYVVARGDGQAGKTTSFLLWASGPTALKALVFLLPISTKNPTVPRDSQVFEDRSGAGKTPTPIVCGCWRLPRPACRGCLRRRRRDRRRSHALSAFGWRACRSPGQGQNGTCYAANAQPGKSSTRIRPKQNRRTNAPETRCARPAV